MFDDDTREFRPRLLVPPFDRWTAQFKVQLAQMAWNTGDPARVARGYTDECLWCDREVVLHGRDEIAALLRGMWRRKLDFQLQIEMWAFGRDRVSVHVESEFIDTHGRWWRESGDEHWEFAEDGLICCREGGAKASRIKESERRIFLTRTGVS